MRRAGYALSAAVLWSVELSTSAYAQSQYSDGEYLVDVYANEQATDVLADFRIDEDGRAFIAGTYLIEAGFDADGGEWVEIGPGFAIDFRFDESTQRLDLYSVAPDPELGRYRPSPAPDLSPEIPAIIMDYGLSYQRVTDDDGEQTTFFGNADIIATRNQWVMDQRIVASANEEETDIVRLQSTLSRDYPDKITRLSVGDGFYRAAPWGRSSTFLGVQYGRDFTLRPEDNQRPFAQLQTLLREQSEIEVIVNGVTQSVRTVNPGVELITPEQIDGINLVEVRIRDALGVERIEDLSFFSTQGALAEGVHDYSVSVGVPRIFNGINNRYEDYFIATGTSRYGVNNSFTLETAAELSSRVSTAGVGGLFTLSSLGAVSVSLSASEGFQGRTGGQLRTGFERRSRNGAIRVQASFASSGYGDLASENGVGFPDRQFFVSASRRTPLGNFRLTYNERRDEILPRRRFLNGGWDYNLNSGPSIFAAGFRDFENDGYGVSVGIRFTFGSYFARSTLENDSDLTRGSLNVGRSRNEDSNWQWSAFLSDGDGPTLSRGDASYQSRFGEYFVSAGQTGSATDLVIGTRGSLIGVNNSIRFKRQIGEAFALVKTPGLTGQTVFKDYREVGKTDKNGVILVEDLRPFQSNTISISPDEISLDYAIGDAEINVIPPRQGVVVAAFDIETDTSLAFRIVDQTGDAVETGLIIRLKDAGRRSVVGYNGRAFIGAAPNDDVVQILDKDGLITEVPVTDLRNEPKIIIEREPK